MTGTCIHPLSLVPWPSQHPVFDPSQTACFRIYPEASYLIEHILLYAYTKLTRH